MLKTATAYLSFALAFGALDFVWLSQMAPRVYRPAIGEIMADQVRWGPALAFYLIYVLGVTLLVVMPALRDGGVMRAAWTGALFGFVAYATYDLTNQATLRVWPTHLSLTDMAWGTVATAVASIVAVIATRMIVRV
ncbi:DUF2177 family protein [Brevundimonas sp.]|uniref:DUF2177 family protein n=1 Tax=Brevundimonas sp. TaxID=1871086 RepID=UPI0025F01A8F|nr:DUF2177 family protein [Brevundimonas sp.]